MRHHDDREGAKQPARFDPAKAARLDDPERLQHVPPARIVELLDLTDGLLLDFGAGTGAFAFPLARLLPRVKILALDEQPEMLEWLRRKLAANPVENIDPIGPEALEPFAGRIHRLLGVNVLHEIGDRDLAGLPPLLAPGGRALFIDWNADIDRPIGPPADHVYGVREATLRLERFGLFPRRAELLTYHYALDCSAR